MIADIVILGAVLSYCAFLVVRRIRNRKLPGAGCCGCSGCAGGCSGCPGSGGQVVKRSKKANG